MKIKLTTIHKMNILSAPGFCRETFTRIGKMLLRASLLLTFFCLIGGQLAKADSSLGNFAAGTNPFSVQFQEHQLATEQSLIEGKKLFDYSVHSNNKKSK